MNELTSLGEFRNEHGELFVVLRTRQTKELFIVGDETAWKPMAIEGDFILSGEEQLAVEKILDVFER